MHEGIVNKLKYSLSLALIIAILVTIGMGYVAYRVKPITISYLGKEYKVKTLANTVRSLMLDKKLSYDKTYKFEPSLDSMLQKGDKVVITKEVELATIRLDITDANEIKIIKIEEEKAAIDFSKERKNNNEIEKGKTNIIQAGKNGEKTTLYKTVYSGNNKVDKIILAENKVDPINEIIEVGTKPKENAPVKGEAIPQNESDVEILARVIYAEARGEPYQGKVAVGAVIVNRVKSSRFPNSIADVVYAPGQFCTVRDGQINLRPSQEAFNAARDAISGIDPSNGALYFYNPRTSTSRWIFSRPVKAAIGNHRFAI
ncbi:MAG: cell wall hydrolase [Clostridia bacterium]